jgi:hypothetical protein
VHAQSQRKFPHVRQYHPYSEVRYAPASHPYYLSAAWAGLTTTKKEKGTHS